jgi:hypothetical protein
MIVASGWTVYALIGVLVLLILWQVVTQWKLETEEAKNLAGRSFNFGHRHCCRYGRLVFHEKTRRDQLGDIRPNPSRLIV